MKPSMRRGILRRCLAGGTGKHFKYFRTLEGKLRKRPTVEKLFASTTQRDDDGLQASYNISLHFHRILLHLEVRFRVFGC